MVLWWKGFGCGGEGGNTHTFDWFCRCTIAETVSLAKTACGDSLKTGVGEDSSRFLILLKKQFLSS